VNNLWTNPAGFSLNSFSTKHQASSKPKPNSKTAKKPKTKGAQKKLTKHNNKNNI
jgi:hypothetical protein